MANMAEPRFISELEELVSHIETNKEPAIPGQRGTNDSETAVDGFPGVDESITDLLDFNFADIEWSYWQ